MKVGFVCQPFDNSSPPDPGGSIGLLTWELARRLRQFCEVTVCAPRSREQSAREKWEGVRFRRVRLRADHWLLDRPRGLSGALDDSRKDVDSLLYYAIYAARSALRCQLEGCDIVHIHNFSQFVPVARLLNPRAKIVLHMNCDWLTQFDRDLLSRRLRHADAIIGCSDYITGRARARFPDYADRCATVYNGVDVAEFSARSAAVAERPGDGKRCIFVGRVSPEKGVHVLLEAFKLVAAQQPAAELKIVGGAHVPPASFIVDHSSDPLVQDLRRFYTTDYMQVLRNQAAALGSKVSFAGFVPHTELAASLREADVFVHPAVWEEPFGMSVAEAMVASLPVITSRAGGLPESVVDGKTGLLVEPNKPAALADAMLRLIADRNLAKSMGSAGAARAKELFSWDVVTARLKQVYDALIAGGLIGNAAAMSPFGASDVGHVRHAPETNSEPVSDHLQPPSTDAACRHGTEPAHPSKLIRKQWFNWSHKRAPIKLLLSRNRSSTSTATMCGPTWPCLCAIDARNEQHSRRFPQ